MTVCDHSVNGAQQKSWEGVWLRWEMGRGGGIRFRLSDCTTAPVQPGTEDCPLLVTCRCHSVQKYTETDRSDVCPPLHPGPPQNRECSGKKARTNGRKDVKTRAGCSEGQHSRGRATRPWSPRFPGRESQSRHLEQRSCRDDLALCGETGPPQA